MNVLVWFKRDLRIADHPALALAGATGAVLPVYIAEPGLWAQPDASARQWAFVAESLADLRDALAARGLPLVIRRGEAVAVLSALTRAHGIARIISHEETGNLWTYARDRQVAAWARGAGVEWTELPQSGVVRRLRSRDGWAARRDAFVAQPPVEPGAPAAVPGVEPGPIPTARALGLSDDPCRYRQGGGRARGLALLDSFFARRGRDYRVAMSAPVTAAQACSRLSPHLAWGTLSVREVAQATAAARAAAADPVWRASLTSFDKRLAWRDHFAQKLEDEPEIETRCLHRAAESLRPRDPDPALLAAWERGETGLPFVDACLRHLAATGWLNFRARAMVMAVASYHLWLDWRATGAILARRFTDYDPGIHWPQVQMQSGTTGINTIRIYNPVKQGRDHDPAGRFVRAWVPELAAVPEAFVHEPWRWPGADAILDRRYPRPVVDPAAAAKAAREAVWALRRDPAHRSAVAGIVARHASRAGPRTTGDRSARPRNGDERQLSFDL